MAKSYFTREELIARDMKNKARVQEPQEKYITTRDGRRIKIETFTREEFLEHGIAYSPEERKLQDQELARKKKIILREEENE